MRAEVMERDRFYCSVHYQELVPSIIAQARKIESERKVSISPWKKFPEKSKLKGYLYRSGTMPGTYEVKTPEGKEYRVSVDDCTCPGNTFYGRCKHHSEMTGMGAFRR